MNKILDWRTKEIEKLRSLGLDIGEVTSVNMTKIEGGCQLNVVPPEFSAGFDVRLAVNANYRLIEDTIIGWCHEAGHGVRLDVIKKDAETVPTRLDDSNHWWLRFKTECDKM